MATKTTHTEQNSTVGLIVPIDVAAVCVGLNDKTNSRDRFAGLMNWFGKLDGNHFRPDIEQPLHGNPYQALEPGIHLHWALPDGLTRTANLDSEQTQLKFQTFPDLWIVARFTIDSTQPQAPKCWVVDSRALHETKTSEQTQITLPVYTAQNDPSTLTFRYAGHQQPLSEWQPTPPPSVFADPLTPVTSGVVSFASFYPNCRSVLGFFDKSPQKGQYMYVVLGWYSNVSDDPLTRLSDKTLAALEEAYGWTFAGTPSAFPSYSLYHGLIQHIEYDKNKEQYFDKAGSSINAHVAIGNSPAEALAAYFRRNLRLSAEFEKMLTALQTGLIQKYVNHPQPDQFKKLNETLHQQQFSQVHSGSRYAIVRKSTVAHDQPLPPGLSADLNLLNRYQQQLDFVDADIAKTRWQFYADLYIAVDQIGQSLAGAAFNRLAAEAPTFPAHPSQATPALGKTLLGTRKYIQQQWQRQLAKIKPFVDCSDLPHQAEPAKDPDKKWKLTVEASQWYWQPNEPSIVVVPSKTSTDAIGSTQRYGNDGRYRDDGYLLCRLPSQTLQRVTVQYQGGDHQTLQQSDFSNAALPSNDHLPHAMVMNALLKEACLLNVGIATCKINGSLDSTIESNLWTALRAALTDADQTSTKYSDFTPANATPSAVGVQRWDGNPWHPMLLQWEVDFQPVHETMPQDESLVPYDDTFIDEKYTINYSPTGTSEMSYQLKSTPTNPTFSDIYQGSSLLSLSASTLLAEWIQDHHPRGSHITQIQHQLQQAPFFAQPLSGLNARTLMQNPSTQIVLPDFSKSPYGGPRDKLFSLVKKLVAGATSVAPQFGLPYNPIRAGFAKLKLSMIGVFGEKRHINMVSPLYTAQSLDTTIHNAAQLPPRLTQPTRLLFRWLSASTNELDEMTSHPASSPVCGWILPDHLDIGMFIYNQKGDLLGTLLLSDDQSKVIWQAAPVHGDQVQNPNQSWEEVLGNENQYLYEVVKQLKSSATFFKAMWQSIDQTLPHIAPHDQSLDDHLAVLVGKPLALVQAALRLETQGSPSLNQSSMVLQQSNLERHDADFSKVKFPVIVGDASQMNDGLVGYFRQNSDRTAYALDTFYCQFAAGTDGVQQPANNSLQLQPSPQLNPNLGKLATDYSQVSPDSPTLAYEHNETHKLLMLVNPTAKVHVMSSFLPTQALGIPASQIKPALEKMQMMFLTTPMLRPHGLFELPVPAQEPDYTWSWLSQKHDGGTTVWQDDYNLEQLDLSQAVTAYTPQSIVEGWLHLEPEPLEIMLLNNNKKPIISNGTKQTLTLQITNQLDRPLTFNHKPAAPIPSAGKDPQASTIYALLNGIVPNSDIANIQWSDPNGHFTFTHFSDAVYGDYVAITAKSADQTLNRNDSLVFQLASTTVSTPKTQIQAAVPFLIKAVANVNDNLTHALVKIQ